MSSKFTYIDLFCGAGGFSLWFSVEGFKNILSVDNDISAVTSYKCNFPQHYVLKEDISALDNNKIAKIIDGKPVDVIIGWPPCQGFSIAWNIGRKFIDDPRNSLFKEFVRFVSVIRPKYFIMENVARLYTHNGWKTKSEIIMEFEKYGYVVDVQVLNAVDFGVPQNRRRVVFFWTRKGGQVKSFNLEKRNKIQTVKEAIWDLPILKSGESSSIVNHVAMNHTSWMLKKMKYISDGGNREDIPKYLRPKTGDARKYIRYDSTKPSITITGDMRKVFHYKQNRALTVRELARLQSFPDSFEFKGSSISQQQQVGNAVPPLMAREIAKYLKCLLQDQEKQKIENHKNIFPRMNYIGNKEKLTNWICDNFPSWVESVFDAFSGWCSVSYEAKKRGYQVYSNDILKINYYIAKSLIQNKNQILDDNDVKTIFGGLPYEWFMFKNYSCVFFYPDECKELDLYRKNIELLASEEKKALAFSLMRRAMIRKMPYSRFNIQRNKIQQLRDEEWSYLKYKRKRAYHNISFKEHFLDHLKEYNNAVFDNGKENIVYNQDIFDLLKEIKADLIYLDPPYTWTMNNYFGFYGLLDEFVNTKTLKPFKNNFIEKKDSLVLFDKLFSNLQNFKYWMLSYNNTSYPSKEDLLEVISKYSTEIQILERKHIYQITGKKNKKDNTEYLFIIKNPKSIL